MDLLVAWGVANAVGLAFKAVLEKLVTAALEDYVKDFFKSCIKDLVDLAKEKSLKVAFGQALKEFLELVQEELEEVGIEGAELKEYEASLDQFIRNRFVLENLGRPFQKALGNTSGADTQSIELEILTETWNNLNLKILPDNFDWARLAERYVRKVNAILRESDELRKLLDSANLAKIRESLEQLAPISPDFEFSLYKDCLIAAYSKLKLDSLDTSGCNYSLQLWNIFVPQNVREESNPQQPIYSVIDLLNNEQTYKYTVILGNPGSGKSTLAQYKVLEWARTKPSALQLQELPFLIELRNYIENRQKSHCKNFLEYFDRGTGVLGGTFKQKDFDELLRNRTSLVIFDGLDEVLDPGERENVVIDIINFTIVYPLARVIVTSRVIGYEQQRQRFRDANFRQFMLQDLEQEQIRSFVNQWHKLAFEDDKYDGEKKRDRLLMRINNFPIYSAIAGNPLLLTMMAILNRQNELPKDRAALYNRASEVLLQHWEAHKNLAYQTKDEFINIDYQDKMEMLRQIAHFILKTEVSGKASNLTICKKDLRKILADCLEEIGFFEFKLLAREFMEQLTSRSFILCFMGGDSYGFVHRTFLEYFCADYFADQFNKKQKLDLETLKTEVFCQRWLDTSWHEILSLIIGMIDERFAGEVIEYVMSQPDPTDGYTNLLLAAKCLSDVRNPRKIKSTVNSLLQQLKSLASQLDATDEIRNQAVAALKDTWKDDPETLRWVESLAG